MKRKILIFAFSAIAFVGLYFALRAMFPNIAVQRVLDVPQNVHVTGYTLVWDSVFHADRYELEIDGEVRTSLKSPANLRYSDAGKSVRVRALGEGYDASAYTEPFAIEFSNDTIAKHTVTYALENKDKYLETQGVLFKEFNYEGYPIGVDSVDLTDRGYEFLFWFTLDFGEVTVRSEAFLFEGPLTVYARCRPIEYVVNYEFGELPRPGGLPATYTVDTIDDLISLKFEYNGYVADGWAIGAPNGYIPKKGDTFTGDVTLYPKISLISSGIEFEKCIGGYALKSYVGTAETLYVPEFYEGEPVVKVLSGAIVGENAPNLKAVVFYGDIYLETGAVGACPLLENLTFIGSLSCDERAIYVADSLATPNVELCVYIYGEVPAKEAFICGYFGEAPNKPVKIFAQERFLNELSTRFPFATVAALED